MEKVNKGFIDEILDNALNIYHYGSFVYGTFVEGISDYDYIVILRDNDSEYDNKQFECENSQYSFYTENTWQQMLDNNEVDAIETYFLPRDFIVKETKKFKTLIVKEKIRENFSRVASNSYVKCKKKLEIEDSYNPKVAKKSLWHSLRIIDFGIQIISFGKIEDYSSVNYLYSEIVESNQNKWGYFKDRYKPLYNSLKTKFRLC